ncbi:hypothetical protein H4Q26_006620 [Puccinia striiformis f. sp. tritici PST-130]|nr:hypothetical protein H4Q26_006620 [Puccinia striiformis f. sp. tritici PST-130]
MGGTSDRPLTGYKIAGLAGPTNLKHQVSKQFACPKPDDVSQGLNSIDQWSISDYAHLSEFLPDHQSGRTNDNHHVSPQNKDFTKFHLNESRKPSLLNKITLPLQGKVISPSAISTKQYSNCYDDSFILIDNNQNI